jgi:hypothetical protein
MSRAESEKAQNPAALFIDINSAEPRGDARHQLQTLATWRERGRAAERGTSASASASAW